MKDNLFNIRNLPTTIFNDLTKLVVNRIGTNSEAFMITKDIIGSITGGKNYRLNTDFINEVSNSQLNDLSHISPLLLESNSNISVVKTGKIHMSENQDLPLPKHTKITGKWHLTESAVCTSANILGGMGDFIIDTKQSIQIPVITATNETLAFYNSQLVATGQIVNFASNIELPITTVAVGESYVNNYLMLPEFGGGAYIEYHNQPHFWLPLSKQCHGHVLLGRKINEEYYLTGFKIPFGYGLYTSPFTLHSDAFLIGEYVVVYAIASEYSTVILKDQYQQLLNLKWY